MMEGPGYAPLTNESRSGRPKNIRILRIRNTGGEREKRQNIEEMEQQAQNEQEKEK
jgi:hypothetical protein